jgi:hypothetical protein
MGGFPLFMFTLLKSTQKLARDSAIVIIASTGMNRLKYDVAERLLSQRGFRPRAVPCFHYASGAQPQRQALYYAIGNPLADYSVPGE